MKITPLRPLGMRHPGSSPRRRQEGMAVIVVIALVAIVLVYIAGNMRTLHSLSGELRLIEKAQKQRLQAATIPATVRTNSLRKSDVSTTLK
jgi:hypothetical protein